MGGHRGQSGRVRNFSPSLGFEPRTIILERGLNHHDICRLPFLLQTNTLIHCLKNPTHALYFKIHTKTQSLFKTLECLRLLCHSTCFGHTLDHLQGMFLVKCCFPPCCFVTILLGYVAGFGGLEVACWPLVPKFASSNPAEAVGFLRAKKSSARLPSEGK